MGVGGFGVNGDANYGGDRYTDLLSKVYPAVKTADPGAQVVTAGLMLPCDDCPPGNFLRGMLDHHGARDGASFFDVLDYHSYSGWAGDTPNKRDWTFPGWPAHGSGRGLAFDKLSFVRGLLAGYLKG
jgi:hypothetical protein